MTPTIDGLDLSVIARWRPNILLVGESEANEAALDLLLAVCREPIHDLDSLGAQTWPHAGTVVLRHLAALDAPRQQAVFDWLTDRRTRVQVVSLAAPPVFSQVASGAFLPALFYRLNVVTFETT